MKKPREKRPWFRLYSELLHDPKVQTLPDAMFKAYINTLCIAGMNDPRGTIPHLEDYAFLLRVNEKQAEKIRNFLKISGLLEENSDLFFIHNWDERQFESDNVTLRTQRHRAKRERSRNVPETFPGTPPERETDTETETETEKEREAHGASAVSLSRGTISFFDLTPARIELARGQGFTDLAWVEKETIKFINRQGRKAKEGDWLNWLHRGKEYHNAQAVMCAPLINSSSSSLTGRASL